jgi:hypothetical protein
MNDTVFHPERRSSRGQRWLAAWRAVAQLGMLVDGRAHTWAGDAVRSEPGRCRSPAQDRTIRTPRLARIRA